MTEFLPDPNVPANRNYLTVQKFRLMLKRAPGINFFVQEAEPPGLSLPTAAKAPTSAVPLKIPGDTLEFEPFQITFIVDEDMQSYLEIWNWMFGLGRLPTASAFKGLSSANQVSGNGLTSDIALIVLDSKQEPSLEYNFENAWPTYLSGLRFNTTDEGATYLTATARFDYKLYTLSSI